MINGSLTLSDVHVRCPGRTILRIDRLEIGAGEFVGIVGTNGAGKTTLLRLCAGLIRPDSGTVLLGGRDLTRLSGWRRCRLRKHIGFIPQSAEYNVELPFTVREVVAMGRTSLRPLLTRLNAQDYEIVGRWIDVLGLSARHNQTFRSLSGGEQQKVLIARAMVQDPRILMLDEPCASLDFHWKYEISEIVERLHREAKMTVLMVSHDTSLLPATCRRVVLLADGRLLGDGDVETILKPEMLSRAYHGDLAVAIMGGRRHILNVRPGRTQGQQDTLPGGSFDSESPGGSLQPSQGN